MPKNPNIKKVLVLGSGPIVIGQAAEFDYAGTQACRALKEEGVEVVLVNSNPATIMTDKDIADHVYIEPLNIASVEQVIEKERPDSILPTLGGQTGLNLAMALYEDGTLEKYGVKLLGTSPDYPPYEFFADAAMTEYAGIDIEVAKYIAESMGMELQIESMNFDNLVTSLSNGDFDIVLAACEYTEERALACDFSDPYYTDLPPVILVKAANADKYKTVDDINQASVIIGAQKNTTKAMAAADMFPDAANGMVLESLVPTLVTELKNGTIDLLVLDGNVGLSYVG